MATKKVTQLTATTTLTSADLAMAVTDVSTVPASKKITIANLLKYLFTGATQLTVGTITDGEFLKRSGTTIISAAAAIVGSITSSGLTQNTGKLLGRSTASSGAIEEITVGSNLTLSAGTLSASGGSNPTSTVIPYNNAGTLADSPLVRKDANTIEQRNGATVQNMYIMNSWTDANNNDGLRFFGDASFNYVQSRLLTGGSPGAGKSLQVKSGSNVALISDDQGGSGGPFTVTWTNAGVLSPQLDATFDFGTTGARWRKGNICSLITSYVENTAATYSVLATDTTINMNRAGTVTVTLGTATLGRELVIRTIQNQLVVSASSNVVPQAGGAASTAILAATAGKFAYLVGDGTNWQIVMSN